MYHQKNLFRFVSRRLHTTFKRSQVKKYACSSLKCVGVNYGIIMARKILMEVNNIEIITDISDPSIVSFCSCSTQPNNFRFDCVVKVS